MTEIKGLEGLSGEQLSAEIARGGKFDQIMASAAASATGV